MERGEFILIKILLLRFTDVHICEAFFFFNEILFVKSDS